MSASLILRNAVLGNAGYRLRPSRPIPSRIARSNAGYDQLPIPVFSSGVMLLLYSVPNGVCIASPPALVAPPGAVWHTAQSPTAASKRPRSRVAADQVPALGGVMGAISAFHGKAVTAMPRMVPKAANNDPNSHFERLALGELGGF